MHIIYIYYDLYDNVVVCKGHNIIISIYLSAAICLPVCMCVSMSIYVCLSICLSVSLSLVISSHLISSHFNQRVSPADKVVNLYNII